MAEYIDRDTAKSKKVYCEERHEYVVTVAEIDWIPAADVYPVRHGRWEKRDGQIDPGVFCSRCNDYQGWTTKYCPTCGAKMDAHED